MQIYTTYKHIQHGYIRLKGNDMFLSIPLYKKHDLAFKAKLIEKGKKLQEKQQKKEKKRTYVKREELEHTYLWWKRIHKKQLCWCEKYPHREKTLRSICYKQAKIYADFYSSKLWYAYNMLRIKRLTSKRWSCSSKQNININLDLVHLPKRYLEYVIAHEVTHLKHKHHQKAFRDGLWELMPWYKDIKQALGFIVCV